MVLAQALRMLTELHGPPGQEDEVREFIAKEAMELADEMTVDAFGNLIALQTGSHDGPKVMVDAHMDEIALVVKHIDSKGMIWVARHGGMVDKLLPGQHVTILSRRGHVSGVVGCKSAHLMSEEERIKVTPIMQLWIDIGCDSADEVEGLGVRVGDYVTYEKRFKQLGKGDYVCSTTLDDRMGCIALMEALRHLRDMAHEANLYAVFSVQEEVGCRGAQLAAQRIKPDIAFILDTGFAEDPATNMKETRLKIGDGPAIRSWEQRYSVPKRLFDFMLSTAEASRIPYQTEIVISGGTDATTIHLAGSGVPTGEVIIARRYSHSPVEVASLRDIENAARLTTALVEYSRSSFVSGFEMRIK